MEGHSVDLVGLIMNCLYEQKTQVAKQASQSAVSLTVNDHQDTLLLHWIFRSGYLGKYLMADEVKRL